MKTVILPLVLAATQLVWWPGGWVPGAPEHGDPLSAGITVLATLLGAAALCLRRTRPVASLVGAAAAITVAVLASPYDGVLTLALADLVALYSVAAWRPRHTWVIALVSLVVWQAAVGALEFGVTSEGIAEYGFMVVAYVVVAGGGVARQQWRAGRQAAADALRQARTAHREAGSGERQRLSAELHDVSAHHLTSIVVSVNAAVRLRRSRPELLAESLTAAATTGRKALAELRALLGGSGPAPTGPHLSDRLAELSDAFTRLGQHVTLEAPDPGPLPLPVTEAAHAVVREALTNTLRYAPGGTVRVRLALTTNPASDVGQLAVVVDNDLVAGGNVVRLGSGRGLAGLRRRVTALGGTLTAGPAGDDGWQVSATVPATAPARNRSERWWAAHRTPLIDVGIVAVLLAFSIAGLYIPDEDNWTVHPVPLGIWPLFLLIAHGAPLLVRSRAPWVAWAGVFATAGLWPLWLTPDGMTDDLASALIFAIGAEAVAVYTVGAHARHQGLSLAVLPASAAVLGAMSIAVRVKDAADAGRAIDPAPTVFLGLLTGAAVTALLVLAWAGGFVVRLRRDGVVRREHSAVTAAVAAAESEARAERARLVGGLREQVLQHTERVVAAADAGNPDDVVAAARAALAAMRELLTALDPATTAATAEPLGAAEPAGTERPGALAASA
ncbi:sensor histidine kinase [Cryptosporangium arvum]|uniref:sensor histidine kinase n=1 Tax=Cryptosporangium arvum TaxID=80871 RepID=UPI0004B12F42|nr:histidine kinase [Cryptosporangium arvum]